jgi:hypothetical protein
VFSCAGILESIHFEACFIKVYICVAVQQFPLAIEETVYALSLATN